MILEMLTSLKLSTGMLAWAVKIRVMPAGKDMVRSPVIFTMHLEGEGKAGLGRVAFWTRSWGFGGAARR